MKPFSFLCIAALFCVLMASPVHAQTKDPVSGFWYTEDNEGGIELYTCGDVICGRIYWMKNDIENGDISRDTHNPNPAKRNRPLCHMQFMGGFKPDGRRHYTDGWIYSPHDGANFSAQMTLVDHNTLDLHGYIFMPLFGESQTWRRAKKMPECKLSVG